jgi:hypothetical protein
MSCQTALDLSEPGPALALSTEGNPAETGSQCGGVGPEIWGVVNLGPTRLDLIVDAVVDDAAATPFDVVLSHRVQCDPAAETTCVNAWWSERLEVLAASGTTWLLLDGTAEFGGAAQGNVSLSIARRSIAGNTDACDPAGLSSRCDDDLFCQAGTCVPTSAAATCAGAPDFAGAEVLGDVRLHENDYFQGSCRQILSRFRAPERVYRITVGSPGLLVADSDFPETTFDTVLYLRQGDCDGPEVACNDDVDAGAGNYRARLEATVTPGTYYLFVDTSTPYVFGNPVVTPRQFRVGLSRP